MNTMSFSPSKYLALLAMLVIGLLSCGKNESPVAPIRPQRGEVISATGLGTFAAGTIQQMLVSGNITVPFTLAYAVEAISLEYRTVDGRGDPTVASGALLIPQGASNVPLASVQHGTQSKDDLVASVSPLNSTEGIVGLIMASMGYAVVIPDYLGFGISNVLHPYLHAESLIPSVIDCMRAGRSCSSEKGVSLNGQVFLTGYSEGGYVSLAVQRTIEEECQSEFSLTAVAPLSGPYDLQGMTQAIFQTSTYSTPAYIAFFFTAYNEVYGWNRLDEIFNQPYAEMMPGLFDGSRTWGEVVGQLPSTFSALVKSTFISDYLAGNESALQSAVRENTLLDWRPKAPIHFFHGDADDVVPIQNAHTAVSALTSNGASNVQLTIIPGGTHETSGPPAAVGAIQWFETTRVL